MSRDSRVDAFRPGLTLEDFQVGKPVRATSWLDLARLVHWVRGRGRTLVPQHVVRKSFTAGSQVLRYRTHPSGVSIARVWVLGIRQDPASFATSPYCEFTVQAGSAATSGAQRRSGRAFDTWPVVYIETPATKTAALTELVLTIARTSGAVMVESVGCWELPRAMLAKTAADLGISLDSFFPRRPIFADTYEGTRPVVNALAGTPGRRVGHVSWAGHEALTTSAGYASVFEVPHRIVPRSDRPGSTTLSLSWDVYARVTDGTTGGDFQIAIGSGGASAALTVALGSTTNAWRGTGTVTLKCEDLSTANGLRGGTYETVDLQFRRTAGAGSVGVSGFNVWEST